MSQLGRNAWPVTQLPHPARYDRVRSNGGWIQDRTRTGLPLRATKAAAATAAAAVRAAGPARPAAAAAVAAALLAGRAGVLRRPGPVLRPRARAGPRARRPRPGTRPYGQRPGAYTDNDAGHTQAFSVGEAPDAYDPYGQGQGQDPGSYDDGYANTYRAGSSTAPPAGPRLHWKQLLSGIVLRPAATFWQMRDYTVWGPALIVTFVYGLLAVFGFDKARKDVLNATMATAIP